MTDLSTKKEDAELAALMASASIADANRKPDSRETESKETESKETESKETESRTEPKGTESGERVVCGVQMTKAKRTEMFGKVAGGAGSMKPEIYQRSQIERLTSVKCDKTALRIDMRRVKLVSTGKPNTASNGFDIGENFDALQSCDKFEVLISLKSVVGAGGAQTRTLREVYWGVEAQAKLAAKLAAGEKTGEGKKLFFANVLDGDCAAKHMDKFAYLLGLPAYASVRDRVFVGDLEAYVRRFADLARE